MNGKSFNRKNKKDIWNMKREMEQHVSRKINVEVSSRGIPRKY